MDTPAVWRCLAGLCLLFAASCSSPERSTGREVKKETRDQRKSPIVFSARQGNYYLNLRENKFFDYFGLDSASNKAELYAGTYELKGDSLFLGFYNNFQPGDLTNTGLVNRAKNELVLLAKDPAKNRKMEIIVGGR
ncbi:MAG TPA: hypothetical protein VFS22_06575 [Flavisolibacter sp.]|nr:hypothetical protein [Flavisolibacter sp.]